MERSVGAVLGKLLWGGAVAGMLTLGGGGVFLYYRQHAPETLASKAEIALQRGAGTKALELIQEGLSRHPKAATEARLQHLMARAYLLSSREDQAADLMRKVLQAHHEDTQSLELLVESFLQRPYRGYRDALKPVSFEAAQSILLQIGKSQEELSKIAPQWPRAALVPVAMGELEHLTYVVLYDQNRLLEQTLQAARTSNNQPVIQRTTRQIAELPKPAIAAEERAIAQLRRALELEPGHQHAALVLQRYLLQNNRYREVRELFAQMQKAQALDPDMAAMAAESILEDLALEPQRDKRRLLARSFLENLPAPLASSPGLQVMIGQLYLQNQELEKAEPLAQKVLAANPTHPDATLLLAQCQLLRQRPQEAIKLLTPLTNSFGQAAQVWSLLAQAHAADNHLALAEDHFSKAITLDPSLLSARRGLMLTLMREEKLDPATTLADQLVRDDRYFLPAWSLHLDGLNARGQKSQAIGELLTLAREKEFPDALKSDAIRLLLRFGEIAEARVLLGSLAANSSGNAEYQRLASMVANAEKDPAKARQLLQNALTKSPDNIELQLQLADLYIAQGARLDARALLDRAGERGPDASQMLRMARAFMALNQLESAGTWAQKALQKEPRNIEAVSLLSLLGKAAPSAPLASSDDASRSVAETHKLAQIACEQKDFSQALTLSRRGLARDPNHYGLHLVAAEALKNLKQQESASGELIQAIKLQPQEVAAYRQLIELYGDKTSAARGMAIARNLMATQRPMACWVLGHLARISGDSKLAQNSFHEGLNTPGVPAATAELLYRGLLELYRSSREDFAKTLEEMAQNPSMRFTARILGSQDAWERGETAQAIHQLELLPTDSLTQRQTMYVAERWSLMGEPQRGIDLLRSDPRRPVTEMAGLLILLYQQSGQSAQALQLAQDLVNRDPGNPAHRVSLAQIQLEMLDYPGAHQTLKACESLGRTGHLAALSMRLRFYARLGLKAAADRQAAQMEGPTDDAPSNLAIAQAWLDLEKPLEARKHLERIEPATRDYLSAQLLLAQAAAQENRLDSAIDLLRRSLQSSADHPAHPALKPLYTLLLKSHRTAEALDLAQETRHKLPAHSQAWQLWSYLASTAAREVGKPSLAAEILLELAPPAVGTPAATEIALLYLTDQQPKKAATWLSPNNHDELLLTLPAGSQNLAIDFSRPATSGLLCQLAAVAPAQWHMDRVPSHAFRMDLERLIVELQAHPQGPMILQGLALVERLKENRWNASALARLEVLEGMYPRGLAEMSFLRYQLLTALGSEATEVLAQGSEKYPQHLGFRLIRAQKLLNAGQIPQALALLQTLQADEPDQLEVNLAMAQCYEQLGQFEPAIERLRVMRKKYPQELAPANNLAYLLAQAHSQDPAVLREARTHIEWALQSAPSMTVLLETRGYVDLLERRPREAFEALRQAILPLRLFPAAHYHLGLVYQQLGQNELARLHLENVAALSNPTRPAPEVALAQKALGR